MPLIVIDPRLSAAGFAHFRSSEARLLALVAYGRATAIAAGMPYEELEAQSECLGGLNGLPTRAHDSAHHEVHEAKAKREAMSEAFQCHAPDHFLMVTAKPLLTEFEQALRAYQLRSPAAYGHLNLVRDRRLLASLGLGLDEVRPAEFFLAGGRGSEREYLIQMAVDAKASHLVTEDNDLLLPGDLCHSDQRTRHSVRPTTLEEFVDTELPYNFSFHEVDAFAVLAAAFGTVQRAA